ncbi:MAG: hypothetical protein AB8G05_17460 [Oligoflexales bacterium]
MKKRDCLYQTYKLNINTQEAFGNGGYRIKTILNDLKRELDNKVERELAGDLQHVLRYPDLLILGYLKQKNFIVEPGSSVEKATWTQHNDPVNNLRPEPVTASTYQADNLQQTQENRRSASRRRASRAPIPVPRSNVSMLERFGLTEVGRIPEAILETIDQELMYTLSNIDQEHFQYLVSNPKFARNDNERLAALSAREVFVLVDQSGSMMTHDVCPMLGRYESWDRWQSARLATENIVDLALSLDRDAQVDIMLWTGYRTGLNSTYNTVSLSSEVLPIFESNRPMGNTPLAEALNDVYENRLRQLLQNSVPFICFILTDGAPNDTNKANEFFRRIILDNNLQQAGRKKLATFSFIQIGDDHAAANYLQHLDDSFILQNGINIDIIDVNQDEFFFGTGRYREQESVGPFAVFWNAIY